uniref:Multiple inositol polyphosphate phosphatase 1 n=1 Tax=Anolis carolinensis TaxID=28377 RepID=H9GM19_ANOCA|nr:PREDICTED: multiple inositol polyphosphate phosphatase 1 isoform X2 [Anolis carolinensis]|eukprot:XP_003224432.1 PREDICTED: multiple inositol polyphosphate phosphatase 1 isoform X2 [Anolis carolinensis]
MACRLLLLLLLLGSAAAQRASDLASYFGTKSRYETIHPHLLADPFSLGPPERGFPLPTATCEPIHLRALVRHGTRFPTRKQIEKLDRLHKELVHRRSVGPACRAADSLAGWKMWFRPEMDGRLAGRGRRDMSALARRLAARIPGLFSARNHLAFASSSKPRCLDSAAAFREGLRQAGHSAPADGRLKESFEVNDKLMRFFDHCEKFVKGVENNSTALREMDVFRDGPEMRSVVDKITRTLCLPAKRLDADLIQVAFFTCSFGLTIKNINSPWCALFNTDDAKVLEYLNDLKQYWKRAYGHDINSRSSCNLFQDIFKHLDQAVSESKSSRAISSPVMLQFGHAETLLPLLALMGYFRDTEPLKADNYAKQAGRQFRSGRIVPYASNLLFLLYHCEKASSPEEKYKVQILLNERLLVFPHSGETVASYSSLKNHYKALLENCHFNEVCALTKTG